MHIKKEIQSLYEELAMKAEQYTQKYDSALFKKAFNFAYKEHEGQFSLSGREYIQHIIGTVDILVGLSVDMTVIVAGMLHNTITKAEVEPEQIQKKFGKEVVKLVQGFTAITEIQYEEGMTTMDLSFIKQVFTVGGKDMRVLLIKIAERIDAAYIIDFFPEDQKKPKAREILDIYVPLIRIFGIGKYIGNLEDECYKYLDPVNYNRLYNVVGKKRPELEDRIEELSDFLLDHLLEKGIKTNITGRIKTIYSISRKIKKKHIPLSGVFDLLALRVVVKKKKEAYEALGIIHSLFKSKENRIKDYISAPKPNGYQSIHTVVTDMNNKPFEVQIQTEEMYQLNTFGLASHSSYKGFTGDHKSFPKWMKHLLAQQKEALTGDQLIEAFHPSVLKDSMICITPKGDEIELPKKSTVLDFAFQIHTNIGSRVIGAWVNEEYIENLMHKLIEGDSVDLELGEEDQDYPVSYLSELQTSVAIKSLKSSFKNKSKEKRILLGKHLLDEQMSFLGYKPFLNMPAVIQKQVIDGFELNTSEELFLEIGEGNINVNKAAQSIYNLKNDSSKYKSKVSLKVAFKKKDHKNIDKLFTVFHELDIQIIAISYKDLSTHIDFHVKDLGLLHEVLAEISRVSNVMSVRRIFTSSVWVFIFALTLVSLFIILSPFVLFFLRQHYELGKVVFSTIFYINIVGFIGLLYFFKYIATVTLPGLIKRKAFWIGMFLLNTFILATVTWEAVYIFDMKNTIFLLSFTLILYGLTAFEYLEEQRGDE